MTRTLRRLVAGTVVVGALVAFAPQANADACYRVVGPDGRVWYFCV